MKKLFLGMAACLTLTTTVLVSCNKTGKEQNTPKTENLQKMSARYSFADFPKNENGILVFRDQAHYDKYIDFLNMAVDSMDKKDTTIDINTVLQDIENGLGFTSIRKTSHEEYVRQDMTGWPSLEAIPDEHFILAQDIRSTLNTALDVKIGEEILHYVSKDFAVRVDAANKPLLSQFKRLPTNVSLGDITMIDLFRKGSSIIELTGDGLTFERRKPTPTGAIISGPFPEKVDPCNQPGYMKFRNLSLDDNGPREAYFTIDFGDNSPTINVSSYGHYVTGNYLVPDFYHQYPVPTGGTVNYQMTITAHYNNGTQMAMDYRQIPVSSNAGCAVKFKDSDWQYTHVPNTNRYVGGKLRMQNIGNSDHPHLRVVAYSKLVKENSDGSFSSFKGEMYLELSCEVKRDDCTTWDHLVGSGWDSHDNNQTLHRTASGATGAPGPYWSMSKSKHGYKHNGTWYWKEITLYPCD